MPEQVQVLVTLALPPEAEQEPGLKEQLRALVEQLLATELQAVRVQVLQARLRVRVPALERVELVQARPGVRLAP